MKLKVRFTAPKCCEDRPGGRSELPRPKVDFAKLDSWWSQVAPMPSYTIPECYPGWIHAVEAPKSLFTADKRVFTPHLRTHPPVTSGRSSPPRAAWPEFGSCNSALPETAARAQDAAR